MAMKSSFLKKKPGIPTILVITALALSLGGCASKGKSADAEVQKGTLSRVFSLVDEQGREAGTLVLNPLGGAILKDADGNVIGNFVPASQPQVPAEPEASPTDQPMAPVTQETSPENQ